MLKAVLYISDSTLSDQVIKEEQISSILNISEIADHDHQVTGVLAYHQKKFFHILEGQPSNVDYFLNKIQQGTSNENIAILIDVKHEDRIYNDWEFIDSQTQKQSMLLGKFLQENIDLLPELEQSHHDILEEFVMNIFH